MEREREDERRESRQPGGGKGRHEEEVAASVTDPVCGAVLDPTRDPAGAERSVYKERTYYFDSVECRHRFEEAPQQFVRDAA